MRSSGVHQVVMNFLINKHNSVYIHDYLNNPAQIQIFILCYQFLALFCMNLNTNKTALSDKLWMNFYFQQLKKHKILRKWILELIYRICFSNDKGVNVVEEKNIKILIKLLVPFEPSIENEKEHYSIKIQILKLLKALSLTEIGFKEEN